MKRFAVFFFTLVVVSLLAVGADSGQAPTIGSKAPTFNLPTQEGGQISLEQFKGKWVVLYFYPKDFTTGCTMEAHNFQRDIEKYTAKNVVILGVSVDSVDSHKSFCTKEGLNFKLLSDVTHEVTQKYGSTMEYNGTTMAARNTFVIDPSGVVKKIYMKVNPSNHSEQVLADLDELQPKK